MATSSPSSQALKFLPLSSSLDPTFWHNLTKLKIDVLKLSDVTVGIEASYGPSSTVLDRATGERVGVDSGLALDGESIGQHHWGAGKKPEGKRSFASNKALVSGSLKNFNTTEDFRNNDMNASFNAAADELWESFSGSDRLSASDINPFVLFTFADLKKYKYTYWFGFPAFVAKPNWTIEGEGWRKLGQELGDAADGFLQAGTQYVTQPSNDSAAFLAKKTGDTWALGDLNDFEAFFDGVADEERTLVFLDPSSHAQAAGWPLRNILSYLHVRFPSLTTERSFRVIALRDALSAGAEVDAASSQSRVAVVRLPASMETGSVTASAGKRPGAVGWEKNLKGKLAPRVADLGPTMDPIKLADEAVDLNLKLMRWRILPELDLDKVKNTKCLLLGAGTLGCYVSRTLMAWGVRNITLVDSATVSFSNPVRQPLFNFDDCLEGGKPKAECAAASLRKVYPSINANGIHMNIPMPGHPVPDNLVNATKAEVEKLEKLIDDHDVIYLLMDSRESRWLPTLLGAAKGKLVMNAALGFDTYLVMRHGVLTPASQAPAAEASASQSSRLGCYYCNDIVAPADSLSDRTLDQMCTVTRPGLAAIASATAVELMVSVVQHPQGFAAPSDTPINANDPNSKPPAGSSPSVLGSVPHQIRGYLSRFDNIKVTGQAYNKCTGCSELIIDAWRSGGFDMLLKAFADAKYLEEVTGLDKLKAEMDESLASADWAVDSEEEDEDAEDDF